MSMPSAQVCASRSCLERAGVPDCASALQKVKSTAGPRAHVCREVEVCFGAHTRGHIGKELGSLPARQPAR